MFKLNIQKRNRLIQRYLEQSHCSYNYLARILNVNSTTIRRIFLKNEIRPPSGNYKIHVNGTNEYLIYENGRVWSVKLEKFLKPDIDRDGYRIIWLPNGKVKLHRLILEIFDRPPINGEQARHLDGNPANNHISNLSWGLQEDNWQDRIKHQRIRSKNKTLTDNQVKRARQLREKYGLSIDSIALMYKVNNSTIHAILTRKNRKYI